MTTAHSITVTRGWRNRPEYLWASVAINFQRYLQPEPYLRIRQVNLTHFADALQSSAECVEVYIQACSGAAEGPVFIQVGVQRMEQRGFAARIVGNEDAQRAVGELEELIRIVLVVQQGVEAKIVQAECLVRAAQTPIHVQRANCARVRRAEVGWLRTSPADGHTERAEARQVSARLVAQGIRQVTGARRHRALMAGSAAQDDDAVVMLYYDTSVCRALGCPPGNLDQGLSGREKRLVTSVKEPVLQVVRLDDQQVPGPKQVNTQHAGAH